MRVEKPKKAEAVTAYARRVVAGKIDAGGLVKLMAVRHLSGLRRGKGLIEFRPEAACRAIDLLLLAYRDLAPAERFLVGSLFGWYSADGTRRVGLGGLGDDGGDAA